MLKTIVKPPRCRWCSQEPEFEPGPMDARICPRCTAMQDPVLNLRSPTGFPTLAFWLNPDDSLFFEVNKKGGDVVRYTLSPEQLQRVGVMFRAPMPLNGRKLDSPLGG